MNEWINCGIYLQWNIIQQQKEGNPAICDNMDELWGHYAKWNKSVRERQMLYDLTYIQNLKKKKKTLNFIDTENRLAV